MNNRAEIQRIVRAMTLDDLRLAMSLIKLELTRREGWKQFRPVPDYLRIKHYG